MIKLMNRPGRMVSALAIALSLAACEPDDSMSNPLSHFALGQADGPLDLALADSLLGSGYDQGLPGAYPLRAGVNPDFGYAPAWDYAQNRYVDYAPEDPYGSYGYDDGYYGDDGYYEDAGYYDDGYDDDRGYYDAGADSGDFMWLALAALIGNLIGDSPPDYGFDGYGAQPWAWRTADGYNRFVEPIYGGNRYYYYAPGSAAPFLVRDPYFSYAYQDDRLIALYDRDGRVINARGADRHRLAAQRYLVRAKDLYRAASRDDRAGVYAADWERQQPVFVADSRAWDQARGRQKAWREWDQRYEAQVEQPWSRETVARREAPGRVKSWRDAAYRGPAPALYAAPERAQRAVVADGKSDRRRGFERLADTATEPRAERQEQRRRRGFERLADTATEPRAERQEQRAIEGLRERPQRAERVAVERPARAERQAQAEHQRGEQRQAQTERQRGAERQAQAERQRGAERQAQTERQRGAERQAQAERQRGAERQAQAERQRGAERQAQAERQRGAERQQQARAERQVQVDRQRGEQQRQAQQQARAERQVQVDRQRGEQQRQAQQQARAERQVQVDRQRGDQQRQAQQQARAAEQQQRQAQQQARTEQQQRQAQQQARAEQQQRQASEQQQRQAQQQARAAEQQQRQAADAAAPAAPADQGGGNGRGRGKGRG